MRVLILGGTGDGVKLAERLAAFPNLAVITSLAGRTSKPKLVMGEVRIGGFGGIAGLVNYLQIRDINLVIDATHPCAGQISWHGAIACGQLKIPYLMLVRPPWTKIEGDRWLEVASVAAAAQVLGNLGTRFFITSGRQQLAPFVELQTGSEFWFLVRCVEPPDLVIPHGQLILARGPFGLEQELELLKNYQIHAIVTKNSGGDATAPKLTAARLLGLPVVMIQRPILPEGEKVGDIDQAIAWVFKHGFG